MKLVTKSVLNQRKEGNSTATIIQTIPKGTRVEWYGYVTECNGTLWYLVDYKNHLGFCSSKYLNVSRET